MLKTPAFGNPIAAFTGRYLDSVFVGDWQAFFRTARAGALMYVKVTNPPSGIAAHDRIVMVMGSAAVAYDPSTFFSRLANRDTLMDGKDIPTSVYNGSLQARNTNGVWAYEHVLNWQKFFYPEYEDVGWTLNLGDGQGKLFGVDADDRGYVYLCGPEYHWGVAFDNGGTGGGLMESIFQEPSFGPNRIWVTKSAAGSYYVMVGRSADGFMQVWDATSPRGGMRSLNRTIPLFFQYGTHNADHFAGTTLDGDLYVYSGDNIASGGAADVHIANTGFYYKDVTTDGTNFYAVASNGADAIVTILRPSGANSFSRVDTTISGLNAFTIRYGSGDYLGVAGPGDAHLLKLTNGVPSEVSFDGNFLRTYYNGPAPSGAYATPHSGIVGTVLPVNVNNKQYMIVAATVLGDVYEIKDQGSVTVAVTGHKGTSNLNAPVRSNPLDVFYGDKVGFAATEQGASGTVTFNFDNSETADNVTPLYAITQQGSAGVDITHQYSRSSSNQFALPSTRTVSATDNLTQRSGSTSVTLKVPVARFGIGCGASCKVDLSTGPIVAGDQFRDESDGDVEGHYAEWKIDTTTKLTKPWAADNTHLVDVGACGAHTLNFAAHYGPYKADFTPVGSDLNVPLAAFSYTVVPFGAALTRDGLTFTATQRLADSSIVTSTPTIKWDLVDSNEAVILAGPTTGASWAVPLSALTAANLRVRFTMTATSVGGSCSSFTTVKNFIAVPNLPDPQITGNCPNGGPTCNFTVSSISGTNMQTDGWSNSWSVNTTSAAPASGTGNTFAPSFSQNGTYTVTVTSTNAIGSKSATASAPITNSAKCPTMTTDNWMIVYFGANSGCRQNNSSNCQTSETINFSAAPIGYPLACATHSYSWNFGDGSPVVTGSDVTHTYSSAGSRNVTLSINNTQQTLVLSANVPVGGGGPPPPTGGGGCATMTTDNWRVTFAGATSGCSYLNNASTSCAANEPLSISIQPVAYLISCATHTFSWNFNDGTPAGSGQDLTHAFASSGTYNVTVTVNNGTQQINIPATIRVGTGSTGGNSCGTMDSGNTFIQYSAPSGCNHGSSSLPCVPNEVVNMSVGFFSYNDTCATHTYTWDFGDGTPGATGRSTTHQFAAGTYTAKCTVNNGKQSFTATVPVVVGSPVKQTFTAEFTAIPDVKDLNLFSFTPTVTPAPPTTAVTKVLWDFGDGSQTTKTSLAQVTNTYTKPGTYIVTMRVSATGSSDVTVSHQVTVILPSRSRGVRH